MNLLTTRLHPRFTREIAFCLLGLATSLVPSLAYTDAFWGVDDFSDNRRFEAKNEPGVFIGRVSGPAHASGGYCGIRPGSNWMV